MDKETRLEALLRTLKLDSYVHAAAQIRAAELAAIKIYKQTHEIIGGRRVKLTKQRKIAKYEAMTAKIFSENIDISKDAINQVKALDRDA